MSPFLRATAVVIGLAGCSSGGPEAGDATSLMTPLWEDSYERLPGGVPPWPSGLSRDQYAVLHNADRIIVATVDPYETATRGLFHGCHVLGARDYRDPSDVKRIREGILNATRGWSGGPQEFYPTYAVRAYSHSENNTEFVVDLLIGPGFQGMHVYTETEHHWCVVDESIGDLLTGLTTGLPAWSRDRH